MNGNRELKEKFKSRLAHKSNSSNPCFQRKKTHPDLNSKITLKDFAEKNGDLVRETPFFKIYSVDVNGKFPLIVMISKRLGS